MRNYLLFLMLAVCISAGASSYSLFTLEAADGTTSSLTAVGTKITFADGTLSAVNGTESVTKSLSDMSSMYFSGETESAVLSLEAESVSVSSSAGSIAVVAPEGTEISVINLTGATLATAVGNGERQVVASSLPRGLYLVKVGSKIFKTLVR